MTTSTPVQSYTDPHVVYNLTCDSATGRAIACSCPSFHFQTLRAVGGARVFCKHMRKHNDGIDALRDEREAARTELMREAARERAIEREAHDAEIRGACLNYSNRGFSLMR